MTHSYIRHNTIKTRIFAMFSSIFAVCVTLFFATSCSLSYFFEDYPTFYAGIVRFEKFHGDLVVDIPSIGLCTIPKAKNIYYLDGDTEIQSGDLITIKFDERKSKMAVAESYPAQFVGTAEYISVEAKNLSLERTEQGFLFSQPNENTADDAVESELYYFIENGGYNGQAYKKLFATAEIVEITETTTTMKLQFNEVDNLENFLRYYPSLEQSSSWRF